MSGFSALCRYIFFRGVTLFAIIFPYISTAHFISGLTRNPFMTAPIAFIGLGLMGAPMASRLLAAGFPLRVYNRTPGRDDALVRAGAVRGSSAEDAVMDASAVVTMLTNDEALASVSARIRSALRPGALHLDCSTVSPALTEGLEREYTASGRLFLHSPVLGSVPQAADGSLLLFAGGSDAAFAAAEPLLRALGSRIWRFPAAPPATHTKLILNSFIAGMIATLSQGLRYAQRNGVEGAMLLEVLSHSALNAPMYQTKGRSILDGNFAPRFFLQNLLKDTNLFRDAALASGAEVPVADMVQLLLERAVAQGLGMEDYSAVVKSLKG